MLSTIGGSSGICKAPAAMATIMVAIVAIVIQNRRSRNGDGTSNLSSRPCVSGSHIGYNRSHNGGGSTTCGGDVGGSCAR